MICKQGESMYYLSTGALCSYSGPYMLQCGSVAYIAHCIYRTRLLNRLLTLSSSTLQVSTIQPFYDRIAAPVNSLREGIILPQACRIIMSSHTIEGCTRSQLTPAGGDQLLMAACALYSVCNLQLQCYCFWGACVSEKKPPMRRQPLGRPS